MRRIANLAAAVTALAVAGIAMVSRAQDAGITLHPGLTVNFSIYGGYDSTGKLLGDYEFINQVTDVSGGGYRYDYWFTGPAVNSGTQTVAPEDKKNGIILREFWPSGDMTAKGYISCLGVSDATFADLQAGKETPFVFDGPDNPKTLKKIGEEDLTTLVNEHQTTLHTIKAQAGTGGTFWILDNPAFPLMVRAEIKWKWMATAISDSDSAGDQVVSSLQKTGEATTHAILFAFNSADLDREAKPVLDSIAQYLKANPKIRLEIQGHTDNIGGAAINLALSQKRADSVKTYLTSAGVDSGRLIAKGYGLTVPVANNTTPEGRANNRRVIFVAR